MKNRRRVDERCSHAAALCLLVLAATLFQAREARAQWTQPDANTVSTTNNVGVGTTAPAARLEVKGATSDATAAAVRVKSATDASLFFVRNDGNVGIGTTSPAARLHVVGTIRANFNDATNWPAIRGEFRHLGDSGGLSILSQGANGTASGSGDINFLTSTSPSANGFTDAPTATRMTIKYDGNVGVGTSNPQAKLEVSGGSFQISNTDFNSMSFRDGDSVLRRHALWISNTNANGGVFGGITNFPAWGASAPSPDALYFVAPYDNNWSQWYPTLTLKGTSAGGSGNVGVGTTSPAYKLDVAGQVRSSSGGFVFPDGTVQTTAASGGGSQWAPAGSSGIYYGGGNVGVGTSGPDQKLGVQGGIALYPHAWVQPTTRGMFMGHGGTSANIYAFNYPAGTGDPLLLTGGVLDFGVFQPGGARTRAMVIAGDGKVGIGTQAPAHTLEVEGTINASGAITGATISATYQDVAEWVPSTQKISAGTVVVLDPERANQVVTSTEAYDTRVAGVVSARPGIALGEGGEGKVLVATTGRVRVRVDATRAPVRIGDLLVTGELPGVAMKSEPVLFGGRKMHAPGTIIGKALEPLEKGTGEILVLLSLQ